MRYWDRHWQQHTVVTILLLPLAALYCFLAWLRRAAYRLGLLRQIKLLVPVIVVGNITVGGTGKTPLVAWLARHLRAAGWNPGIITRGYRGQSLVWPVLVEADSDPVLVGDEAVLLARQAGCPVAAGPDRVAAGRLLGSCDVILSDDGLQHYRLGRDIEIAVIDGERRFGNGLCLPAGPLRELRGRLKNVDVIVTQGTPQQGECGFRLEPVRFCPVGGEMKPRTIEAFRGERVHALAGIGNPQRFFDTLRSLGANVIPHPLPDHHMFSGDDIRFEESVPVIMTEKDAVKCSGLAGDQHWYLAVEPQVDPRVGQIAIDLLNKRRHGQKTS